MQLNAIWCNNHTATECNATISSLHHVNHLVLGRVHVPPVLRLQQPLLSGEGVQANCDQLRVPLQVDVRPHREVAHVHVLPLLVGVEPSLLVIVLHHLHLQVLGVHSLQV